MMIKSRAQVVYFGFLLLTLAVTLLIYGAARQWSFAAVFFVVINIGNAHYIMAYLASARHWQKLSPSIIGKRLALWFGASALYFIAFYSLGLPFAWALLSVLVIATHHFFRDYAFFYHQFSSSFIRQERPFLLTLFLGSLYIAFLFLTLYYFPEKIRILFAGPIPQLFFGVFGLAASLAAIVSGYYLFFQRFSYSPRHFAAAFALPYGSLGIAGALGSMNPIDLVYILVLWHYILWLGFTFVKVAHRSRFSSSNALSEKGLIAFATQSSWSRIYPLLLNASITHILIFLLPLLLLLLGFWNSFPELARQSFVWGLYGYPFWSFLHIVFTAFPHSQKALKPALL